MKKSDVGIWAGLGLMGIALVGVMLYCSSMGIIEVLHLGLEPSLRLPFDLAKFGTGRAQIAGKAAIWVSFGTPVLIALVMGVLALLPKRRGLHGDARFATRIELADAGLLTPDNPSDEFPSLVVGKLGKDFLLWRGQQFLFLAAPTRSGKGVGIVIPNLLHYSGSVVNLDIKGENFDMTSGFRYECGQEVHRFSPDDESCHSAGWNPLDYIRDEPLFRVADVMRIGTSLYPIRDDDVWGASAQQAFIGLVLYMLETGKYSSSVNCATVKSLAVALPCLADEPAFREHIESRKAFEPLSEDCINNLLSFVRTSDKQRASIMISFNKPLVVFADPIAANATRKSTFDLRDVRRKRMSIYVCIQPGNLARFEQMLNLFFEQLLNLNMQSLPQDDPSLKYQCLVLLDEFPSIGKMVIVEKASGYAAGYNMRLLIISQSKSQLEDPKLYGEKGARSLFTNMALQVCYAPRDDADARDYSEMIGYYTETGRSTSRKIGFTSDPSTSESKSEQKRAVMLPQELKAMGADKQVISLENVRPALVDKIRWYKEPVFIGRANKPTPPVPYQMLALNTIERGVSTTSTAFVGADTARALAGAVRWQVGFSPKRNALEVVLGVIAEAKTELLVAAYSMTHQGIAHALVDARNRGVTVQVVVDFGQNGDDQAGYKAVDYLESQGLPVYRSKNYSAMHHKFMVADKITVQIGSFNYTASADLRNAELALVLHNVPDVAAVLCAEWERLAYEPVVSVDAILMIDRGLAILAEFGI